MRFLVSLNKKRHETVNEWNIFNKGFPYKNKSSIFIEYHFEVFFSSKYEDFRTKLSFDVFEEIF